MRMGGQKTRVFSAIVCALLVAGKRIVDGGCDGTNRTDAGACHPMLTLSNANANRQSRFPAPRIFTELLENKKKPEAVFAGNRFHSVGVFVLALSSSSPRRVHLILKSKDAGEEVPRGTVEAEDDESHSGNLKTTISNAAIRETWEELRLDEVGLTSWPESRDHVGEAHVLGRYSPPLPELSEDPDQEAIKTYFKAKTWWATMVKLQKSLEDLELPRNTIDKDKGKSITITSVSICPPDPLIEGIGGGPEGEDSAHIVARYWEKLLCPGMGSVDGGDPDDFVAKYWDSL